MACSLVILSIWHSSYEEDVYMKVKINLEGGEDEEFEPWDFATLGLRHRILVDTTFDSANLLSNETR